MDDFLKEYVEFEAKMRAYDYMYYVQGTPVISNEEYDGLVEKLKYLENKYNIPDYMRASERVGIAQIGEKISHLFKMYSMDKVYDIDSLLSRLSVYQLLTDYLLMEWKYDGIAVEVVYRDGKPIKVVSRGNGIYGIDCTYAAFSCCSMSSFPIFPITTKGTIAIVGEIVLPVTAYNYYPEGSNLCAIVSGMVMGKEPKCNQVRADFIAYDFMPLEGTQSSYTGTPIFKHSDIVNTLSSWGFNTPNYTCVKYSEIVNKIDEMTKRRNNYDYPVDGIVIKVDELATQQSLGYTQKFPKFHIAYKWAAPVQDTVIRDIVYTTGIKGRVTPVAIVDPIYWNGKQFTKVNLHVFDTVTRNCLNIGSKIQVTIVGGLIPKFIAVIDKAKHPHELPDMCPVCHFPLKVQGAYSVCINPNCPNKKNK